MKRTLISLLVLMLAAAMTIPVFAENTDNGADAALTEETAGETAETGDIETGTDTQTALAQAQQAYAAAKQSADQTDYEAELKAMVEAGSLTQEQADLLLTAQKEQTALRSGVCPSCGYEFQYANTGRNSRRDAKGFGRAADTQDTSDDETALEQAQDAYSTAKQNSQLTDYEAELKAMVEAGSLTQEQADLLLNAEKESESLANGICPSCGYQFQTVTSIACTHDGECGMKNGKGHGGRH